MNTLDKWLASANRYPRMRGTNRLGEHRAMKVAGGHLPKLGGKARTKISNTWRVENFTHRKMW